MALSSGEDAHLVGVGTGIEVTAYHYRVVSVSGRGNELDKLADLGLSHAACTEWVIQHHGEELNRPPVALNGHRQYFSDSRITFSSELASFDDGQRPAGDEANA